jgi:PRC-barrel domain
VQLKDATTLTSESAPPFGQFERLITADGVAASHVYSRAGDTLGTVERLLIDRVSGRITYAIIAITAAGPNSDRRQPLPWSVLTYDPLMGGYLVNLDRKVLENGPTFASGSPVDWNSETWNRRLHEYYRVPHFWI